MSSDPLPLLMLSELPRVGEGAVLRVQRFCRRRHLALADVLRLPPAVLASECSLPKPALELLTTSRDEHARRCSWLLSTLRQAGICVCTPDDAVYPARWRQRLPPPIVYLHGNVDVLAAATLTVLSSRGVTARGVSATVRIVEAGAREGFTFITGGMKSTHRIAAVAVRAAAAARAIVLDRGLLATFGGDLLHDPFGFGPGRAPLDLQRTLVLSPFRLNDHAVPRNGRRRDALMAALADAIVAVHARPSGEIERTCLRALDAHQCVLSWHGENPGLVAAGATPIYETDLDAGLMRFVARTARP